MHSNCFEIKSRLHTHILDKIGNKQQQKKKRLKTTIKFCVRHTNHDVIMFHLFYTTKA